MKKRHVFGLIAAVTVAAGVLVTASVKDAKISKADEIVTTKDYNASTDAAYKQVVKEEEYIVKLVSSKLNKKLTREDWRECLTYLSDNFDELVADKNVDATKVVSYVEAYQALKYDEEYEAKIAKMGEATGVPEETGVNFNYDPVKAVEYMNKYYDEYNPEYPDFNEWGGDCANFVSQCLYAGGMKMKGTQSTSFDNWFCRTNVAEEFSKSSSTWRGAVAFGSYWKKNAIDYKEFGQETFSSRKAFQELYKYANPGDAISLLDETGRPYHTIICSYKNKDNDGTIRFAAHTGEHLDENLYYYVKDTDISVRVYKLSEPTPEQEASYNYDLVINDENEWLEYEEYDEEEWYDWGDEEYWDEEYEDEYWEDEEYWDEEYEDEYWEDEEYWDEEYEDEI